MALVSCCRRVLSLVAARRAAVCTVTHGPGQRRAFSVTMGSARLLAGPERVHRVE